jgi:hypothetical protein
MPKGSANCNPVVDLIHIGHIENGLSLGQAAKLSRLTYIGPDSKVCRIAKQRFHYLKRQYSQNSKNFSSIKSQAKKAVRHFEDNSISRAKEEQALLADHLSYFSSSSRDHPDDASFSTTATINSPVLKKQAPAKNKKTAPAITISIPTVENSPADTTSIKMENKKYISKLYIILSELLCVFFVVTLPTATANCLLPSYIRTDPRTKNYCEPGNKILTYFAGGLIFVIKWVDTQLHPNVLNVVIAPDGMSVHMKIKKIECDDPTTMLSKYPWGTTHEHFVVKALGDELNYYNKNKCAAEEWTEEVILHTPEEVIREFVNVNGETNNNKIKYMTDKDGRQCISFFLQAVSHDHVAPKAGVFDNGDHLSVAR